MRELRALAAREYRRHAEALVGGEEATEYRSQHFLLRSDYPARQGLAAVAELLEETSRIYRDYFRQALGEDAELPLTTVYLLTRKSDYDRLATLFLNAATSRGHFVPEQGVIVLHLEREVRENLVVSAVHEAVHVLNHHLLGRGRAALPPWLDEGLAMYFALTRVDEEGRFVFGKIDERRALVDGTSLEREGATWLKGLRRALTGGQAISLATVLDQRERGAFFGPERHLYYGESWTLVHFLLHAEGGTWKDPFLAYLEGVREGRVLREDLEDALGRRVEALERDWRNHVIYRL
jgi:hypothetical protein